MGSIPTIKRFTQWATLVGAATSVLLAACSPSSAPLPSGGNPSANSAPRPAASSPAASGEKSPSGSALAGDCPPSGSATRLDGAGATFPAPIYQRWFADYKSLCNVEVNYQPIGSGGGIQQHTQKAVQFGASDGILTQQQKDQAPGTLMIPTVAGPEAIIFNLSGVQSGQLRLTPDVLAGIFLGEITKWNDPKLTSENRSLNLPNEDIVVVHRSDGSGTTNIFTTYLSTVNPTWSSRVGAGNSVNWPVGLGGEGNAGVAGQVRQLPGAIGYVEFAYAKQNTLPWALLKNKAGQYIEPSLEATTAAMEGVQIPESTEAMIVDSANSAAYPIAGFTWILVYEDQSNAAVGQTIAHLLWWATHDGQRTASELDYAPLSPAAQKAAENQIHKIKVNGSPVL